MAVAMTNDVHVGMSADEKAFTADSLRRLLDEMPPIIPHKSPLLAMGREEHRRLMRDADTFRIAAPGANALQETRKTFMGIDLAVSDDITGIYVVSSDAASLGRSIGLMGADVKCIIIDEAHYIAPPGGFDARWIKRKKRKAKMQSKGRRKLTIAALDGAYMNTRPWRRGGPDDTPRGRVLGFALWSDTVGGTQFWCDLSDDMDSGRGVSKALRLVRRYRALARKRNLKQGRAASGEGV
ncbi:hypothetical protein [Rhizobium phage RHph_X2_26]|nr:hypothetical protein [Rhizobium phage RHph_X2_26]